jgi:hypothetical protein
MRRDPYYSPSLTTKHQDYRIYSLEEHTNF